MKNLQKSYADSHNADDRQADNHHAHETV